MTTGEHTVRALVTLVTLSAAVNAESEDAIDFEREIRPILSEQCYSCHGPDRQQRQAGLRLDRHQATRARLPSGGRAIVPGNPTKSLLWQRISSPDRAKRMPPINSKRSLELAEIELIREWIQQGATWQKHWAYTAPVRAPFPPAPRSGWARQPLDCFVFDRFSRKGFQPSESATEHRLLRRVFFDLTGLPPTPHELLTELKRGAPDAYERTVDRLLSVPAHGEHLAQNWLDLARYADTHGYHIDSHRDMWRWRDWVIDAYNMGMPYNQFTIQQLAGDLLPDATLAERIATGFNRNNMVNFEGGALAEEYLVEYAVDRVNTTSTVWLAQTMRCARCHDHKYDPLTQRDFFQLLAYFNRVPELGLDGRKGNATPFVKAPTPLQRSKLEELRAQVLTLTSQMAERKSLVAGTELQWAQELAAGKRKIANPAQDMVLHLPLEPVAPQTVQELVRGKTISTNEQLTWFPGEFSESLLFNGTLFVDLGDRAQFERTQPFSVSVWVFPTTTDTMTLLYRGDQRAERGSGYELQLDSGNIAFRLVSHWPLNALQIKTQKPLDLRRWYHVAVTYDGSSRADGVSVYIDGKRRELVTVTDKLAGDIAVTGTFRVGRRGNREPLRGMLDDLRIYPREVTEVEVTGLANSNLLQQIAAIPATERSLQQQQRLQQYYLTHHDEPFRRLAAELEKQQRNLRATEQEIPTTMVMQEDTSPRDTFILARGDYREKLEKVDPSTPDALHPPDAKLPRNRLGLAQWLVSAKHPLTARVCVNRYWQHYFGRGIVLTSEDFGTRGDRPTHPRLLDWLAIEFVHRDWDLKQLQRSIVTSATYRQTARTSASQRDRDPSNQWLARGPRSRRSAESIRDAALAESGLLVRRVGGPSVYPYQPRGLWKEISFNPRDFTAQVYKQSRGADLYRRGIYTFWKRAVPPPTLEAFGAPNRETCTARRIQDNTVLQALVVMNDPAFVEAARELATRVLERGDGPNGQRLLFAFQLVLGRSPSARETSTLSSLLATQQQAFREDRAAALRLIRTGDSIPSDHHHPADLAAWTTLCSLLLGLDEAISK